MIDNPSDWIPYCIGLLFIGAVTAYCIYRELNERDHREREYLKKANARKEGEEESAFERIIHPKT